MNEMDPTNGPVRVRRALVSVSDKTGVVDFARGLASQGVEILSTGGTASAIREAGIEVTDVSEFTGQAEILDGRVKTLHPRLHAAILARRSLPEHLDVLEAEAIEPIDLVCVNLYPFEKTIADPEVTPRQAIENIDIGGPTMVRAAAKNHEDVVVVVKPESYDAVLEEMEETLRWGLRRGRRARSEAGSSATQDNKANSCGQVGGAAVLRDLGEFLEI